MPDPSPDERQRVFKAQVRVSGSRLRVFSSAVSTLAGLFIFLMIALLAFKMRDPQAKGLFAALIFTLILVAAVGSALLWARRLLRNLAGSTFQNSADGNRVSFKWTVGPVVTKTKVLRDLSELPPELASNPEVQLFLHRPEVQKLLQQRGDPTIVRSQSHIVIDVGSANPSSATPQPSPLDTSVGQSEVRVITNASELPSETAELLEAKPLGGQQPRAPTTRQEQRPDILKWLAMALGILVLVLGFLTLFFYLRSVQH